MVVPFLRGQRRPAVVVRVVVGGEDRLDRLVGDLGDLGADMCAPSMFIPVSSTISPSSPSMIVLLPR